MEEKKWRFFSWGMLWSVLIVCALSILGEVLIHGLPLIGFPKAADVAEVTIVWSDEEGSAVRRDVAGTEDVELAVNAAGLLRYRMSGEGQGSPEVSLICRLKDGDEVRVEASRTAVWWKGKAHVLKEEDIFINIIQGVFFKL